MDTERAENQQLTSVNFVCQFDAYFKEATENQDLRALSKSPL